MTWWKPSNGNELIWNFYTPAKLNIVEEVPWSLRVSNNDTQQQFPELASSTTVLAKEARQADIMRYSF